MDDIRELNGKVYLVIKCRNCDNEMFFSLHEDKRRVYAACAKCGKGIEVEVPALKK